MAMPNQLPLDVNSDNLAYIAVELDNTHPTPVSWNSQDTSTGFARVLIDLETREIFRMEMVMEGMFAFGDPESQNILQQNLDTVQPFHFHNVPQGGPQFFVQQLFDYDQEAGEITTATLENTDTGFRFEIDETYAMRPPVNNPALEDVVSEALLDGTGYLGLHTAALPVPATAIAGQTFTFGFGEIDGDVKWYGDDGDVGIGSRDNDVLSMGGGDDFALGKNGDDIIDGGEGDDVIFGGRGDDTAWGGDGNDNIRGNRGDDTLYGNRGDDELRGNRGDDELIGGNGEDLLDGGRDDDILTGGADGDTFLFRLFSGSDVITDFNVEEDTLHFVGRQRVLDAELLDLDGGGEANDTLLTLIGGEISVLNVDLVSEGIA
jgi:hypothetical protein